MMKDNHLFKTFGFDRNVYMAGPEAPKPVEAPPKNEIVNDAERVNLDKAARALLSAREKLTANKEKLGIKSVDFETRTVEWTKPMPDNIKQAVLTVLRAYAALRDAYIAAQKGNQKVSKKLVNDVTEMVGKLV